MQHLESLAGQAFLKAFDIAIGTDAAAVHVRASIARLAQQAGVAPALGSLVADAIAGQCRLLQEELEADPERHARHSRLVELDHATKQRFLAGDLRGAKEIYLSAEDLRPDHEQQGRLGAHVTLLGWMLEAGDLQEGVRFFKATDWRSPYIQVAMACGAMRAFGKAGQRPAGLGLLRSLRSVPDAADAHEMLSYLGQALWVAGETDEGVATIRDAARTSLAQAAVDPHVPLWGYSESEPIPLAQLQCTISDREGAVETLNGVQQLCMPVEYGPPRPRPADLPPNILYMPGPTLKPASKRWTSSLAHLLRVLAYAGMDDAALSLAGIAQTGQLGLLGEVVRGQAKRGAFDAAFRTLDMMNATGLSELNEPSRIMFRPDGTVTAFTQASPIRPVEAVERAGAVQHGLGCIRRYAADQGKADAFHRADRLSRDIPVFQKPLVTDRLHLDLLVRRGGIQDALEEVSQVPGHTERLLVLQTVMECFVKVLKPTRDDILGSSYG